MTKRLFFYLFGGFIVLAGCSNHDKKTSPLTNAAMAASGVDSSKMTTIEWVDPMNRDFGKIAEGQKLEVAFRFRNAGDQPLIIEKVQPSCGCTIAEQPEEPIAPGKEGVIKAAFNSEGRVGSNHKTLYVYANTKGSRSQELQFEVVVEKRKW
jgi:Protein of unknown function (DUF1573)